MAKKQYNVKTSAVAATERRARKYGVAGGSAYVAGGYIDMAGDVAGKLDRGVFESMFERIVTGTDDDGNEKWYIKAKATLVSVGDVVAYGVSDITGGAGGSSTLANLKDVLLGTLKDGDVIKWDASLGKWVNSQGGGGLDEDSLAAYLTANNYVTSAALGDYVTVDTEQTISGKKTFGAGLTIAAHATLSFGLAEAVSFDICGNLYRNSQTATNWSIYDTDATSKILDVDMRTGDLTITGKFIKAGGTSSQFLKADGSVDDTQYLYHRRCIPGFDVNSITAAGGGLYEIYQATGALPFTSSWHKIFDWGSNDSYYRVQMCTSYVEDHEITYRHKIAGTWYDWKALLDSSNYANYINGTHLLISGANATHAGTSAIVRSLPEASGSVLDTTLFVTSDNNPAGNSNYNYYRRSATKIWDYVLAKDGSGSGLDADLLDGRHCYDYVQKFYSLVSPDESITWQDWLKRNGNNVGLYTRDGWSWAMGGNINVGWETINAESYSALVCRQGNLNSAWGMSAALFIPVYPEVKIMYLVRAVTASEGVITGQSSLRFADYDTIVNGNVASATVLQNTRYLWGQAFNGGGDVNGTFYYNNGDGTLKIYGIAPQSYGHETVAIQTAFDAQDPETSPYPYTYPDRNVLTLQPRGGRVGIGLANPSCMLHVNGTILANGDVTAYSDARLKSDIRPLTNRGFVEPKTYIKDGKRSIGFLAQDVMALYPELVTDTGGADHWLALNYGNLVAVLEAQIIDHEERIKRLEERV